MNRNLQLTIAWFALAFLVTLGAVWQAQVTVAQEVIARNQPPPPPLNENLPKYWYANLIFPFLSQQDFGFRDPSAFDHPIVPHETLLESIRHVHPAQLKTLLLLCPYLVEAIQQNLETAKQ